MDEVEQKKNLPSMVCGFSIEPSTSTTLARQVSHLLLHLEICKVTPHVAP